MSLNVFISQKLVLIKTTFSVGIDLKSNNVIQFFMEQKFPLSLGHFAF